MILAMGRRERDSSPMSSLPKSCPAKMPLNIRMVEPELPQSKGTTGACSFDPRPSISTALPFRVQLTPRALRQARVLAQSAPVEKFSRRVFPSAIPANIA